MNQIQDLTEEERKYLFEQWRCPDCGDPDPTDSGDFENEDDF